MSRNLSYRALMVSDLFVSYNLLFCSFQTAPCERRHIRTNEDDTETGEASFSGQDDTSSNLDILEWSKVCKFCYLVSFFYAVFGVTMLLTLEL